MVPEYLTVDWILGQYGSRLQEAQREYRAYVLEGIGTSSPWERLQGQIYLGGKDFVRKHQPDRVIQEVPRGQTQAHRPGLQELFSREKDRGQVILQAYRLVTAQKTQWLIRAF